MPSFSYTAKTPDGTTKKGTQAASSKQALELSLTSQGLTLLSAKEASKKGSMTIRIPGLSGVKLLERVLFTRHLQIMIKAGLSITRSLEILIEQTENTIFKEIIVHIKNRVEQGQTLTDSMRRHPKVFPPIYTSMVEVGEVGGTLEDVLEDLATQLKKDYELMTKVRGAMTYPAVILAVMIVVIILMLVYVLPQLVEIFREVEGELPITTRGLIALSDVIQGYGVWIALGILLAIVGLVFAIRTPKGMRIAHWLYTHVPVFGDVVQKVNLARFSRTTSVLLHSDISIVRTFSIVEHVLANVWYKDVMHTASEQVKKGVSISESLSGEQAERLFPPVVRQMVSVGEQTGTLDAVLADLADFYEKDVTQTTDNLSSIIEPVLMVILGAGVGLVAISVISPIYSLVGSF